MRTDTRARLDSMIAEYQAMAARLDAISTEAAALTATARSADQSVCVTVGPHGELTALSIDEGPAERLDTRLLAGRILEAAALATAQVRNGLRSAVSDNMPEGLHHLVGPDGNIDVRRLLPRDPGESGDRVWPGRER